MALRNGEIVNVDLTPILFELVQLIRDETADDLLAIRCNYGDEMPLGQQPCQVIIAWKRILVGIDLVQMLRRIRTANP